MKNLKLVLKFVKAVFTKKPYVVGFKEESGIFTFKTALQDNKTLYNAILRILRKELKDIKTNENGQH